MNDIVVTCRVCDATYAAYDDGVLLCGECRTQPEATRVQINQVFDQATDRWLTCLDNICGKESDAVDRYGQYVRARRAAHRAGGAALLAFERRLQKTLAAGDAFARLLEADEAHSRVARWYHHADRELDALIQESELFV